MVNIILNGKEVAAFPLRTGTQQECPLSPPFFNRVIELVASAIRKQKEIKAIQTGKEEVKIPLFLDNMILYVENTRVSNFARTRTVIQQCGRMRNQCRGISRICRHLTRYRRQGNLGLILLIIAPETIKYLGINIMKEVKDL